MCNVNLVTLSFHEVSSGPSAFSRYTEADRREHRSAIMSEPLTGEGNDMDHLVTVTPVGYRRL